MILRTTIFALALTLGAGTASAQAPSAPRAPSAPSAIGIEQARRIAQDNGVARIEEIELDDGIWEIEGRDAAGAEIELDLRASDGSDGSVIKIERDRPSTAVRP